MLEQSNLTLALLHLPNTAHIYVCVFTSLWPRDASARLCVGRRVCLRRLSGFVLAEVVVYLSLLRCRGLLRGRDARQVQLPARSDGGSQQGREDRVAPSDAAGSESDQGGCGV